MINPLVNRMDIPNVVLVGGTGSGKSSVGRVLASLLGFGVIDLDAMLEKKQGREIAAIFAEEGEHRFRELETELIESLSGIRNHVIITGAGAVEKERNWENLGRLGRIVWMATPIGEVVNRFLMRPGELEKRPLLAKAVEIEDKEERYRFIQDRLQELQDRRQERYSQASCTLVNSFSTPEAAALMIKNMLESGEKQPWTN